VASVVGENTNNGLRDSRWYQGVRVEHQQGRKGKKDSSARFYLTGIDDFWFLTHLTR
jgi:hypothetical protein